MSTCDFLEEIMKKTLEGLRETQRLVPLGRLREMIATCSLPRDFLGSLAAHKPIALVAEIKRASPSKGSLAPHLDPEHLAKSYEEGGAAGISVVTEEDYFLGSLKDLAIVKKATRLPVLRKDFILDPYQVYESRAFGADAVLLIVRCLKQYELNCLLNLARSLGMDALVEVHDEKEAECAVEAGARIIGVNNRDLKTFGTSLQVTEVVAPRIPRDRYVISESGIETRDDMLRVKKAGANGVLVGESLVKESLKPDGVQDKIQELVGNGGASGQWVSS